MRLPTIVLCFAMLSGCSSEQYSVDCGDVVSVRFETSTEETPFARTILRVKSTSEGVVEVDSGTISLEQLALYHNATIKHGAHVCWQNTWVDGNIIKRAVK